ncbi:hypothetical protein E2C01_083135 [Portunus trituberculatus]|uniref:Uncharacterized protein n=1 Tax=Portunus trituberculatus TaxID=210409 RepID=A0A5B7J0C6_PORTR|nr:hypothetical protein [Portunus trituberculatus]
MIILITPITAPHGTFQSSLTSLSRPAKITIPLHCHPSYVHMSPPKQVPKGKMSSPVHCDTKQLAAAEAMREFFINIYKKVSYEKKD